MEEMMMMMRRSPENLSSESISDQPIITTSTCPTWKLYDNPFYYSQHPQYDHCHHHQQEELLEQDHKCRSNHFHCLHLPISARKIGFRAFMDSELDLALAQIIELKEELEFERKARKKLESVNKKLSRDLCEERRGRQALERVCEELAKEISSDKSEIDRMKTEMEEERKMSRVAEVLREERVQMKLTDAKHMLEEKLLELEVTKQKSSIYKTELKNQEAYRHPIGIASGEPKRCVLSACNYGYNNAFVHSVSTHRIALPEPENPHIKRGIKGFVEFPKVVRAIGSKSRHLGTKLECQKAQLRILLKQKSPIRSKNLLMS
ncbi:protein BRANCHLESS TRICHOME [Cornus florida]|uniref:protein BRANCHLESS TRICHOME n=1 Tax=Cornus florida TaxID=4283 RepID=UPI002898C884|nr:protein BRANCHLESS TRICHOME [Cornus florida]